MLALADLAHFIAEQERDYGDTIKRRWRKPRPVQIWPEEGNRAANCRAI
jgi:hypothetical protein